MSIALLCVDLVNDYVSKDGKLAEGFAEFAKDKDVLQRVNRIQEHFREQGGLVIHARTRFNEDYMEINSHNPYYNKVRDLGALKMKEWGSEFPEEVAPKKGEVQITKHRNSPFYRSRLELVLRTQKVEELYIIGCGTAAAISLAAREAADRDFAVTVVSDACIDVDTKRHEAGIDWLSEVANVKEFKDIALHLVS